MQKRRTIAGIFTSLGIFFILYPLFRLGRFNFFLTLIGLILIGVAVYLMRSARPRT